MNEERKQKASSGSTSSAPRSYVLRNPQTQASPRFLIDYAKELNPEQLAAVKRIEGPQLLIAGAGTGKTRTLVYRVAYLIESGIDPEQILLLTFTRKAAQEMMRRAAQVLDERCRSIQGGTFHSFAAMLLRTYASVLGYTANFTILDRGDAEDILQLLRGEEENLTDKKRFPKKSTLLSLHSMMVNTGKTLTEVLEREYPQFLQERPQIEDLLQRFREYKRTRSLLDYDDLLLELQRLLLEQPEVRQRLSRQFRYVMIDEFQDTNYLQAEISLLLASEHNNIMVVGDDSQSIYSFRGADFQNIMEFPKRFANCTITKLEHNYRSTTPILALTNAIISSAHEKYEKKLYSTIESEQRPVYIRTTSFDEQAAFVCQRVLELREEGVALDRIAVLFRSGWHSNELEIELGRWNIPFVKYGGLKFIEAAHIKDMIALLRVSQNRQDGISWYRQLLLLEGIGPKTARELVDQLTTCTNAVAIAQTHQKKKFALPLFNLCSVVDALANGATSPEECVLEAASYYHPLLKSTYEDFRKREDDLQSLARIASRYTSLRALLDDVSLEPPDTSQTDAEQADTEDEHLILSTIHSAKGLEWHSVFILSMLEGFLPSAHAIRLNAELEEERRLLYVACTRAEKNLYLLTPELTRTRNFSTMGPSFAFSEPSRFLREIHEFESLTETWNLTQG